MQEQITILHFIILITTGSLLRCLQAMNNWKYQMTIHGSIYISALIAYMHEYVLFQ